jgi:hypothetical protein
MLRRTMHIAAKICMTVSHKTGQKLFTRLGTLLRKAKIIFHVFKGYSTYSNKEPNFNRDKKYSKESTQ